MTKQLASVTITNKTIGHYETSPCEFWLGTKDHDVTQNYDNLLKNIKGDKPFKILDLGCGPGRDLKHFADLGHEAYGLDGCASFCKMAREYSGCEVYHQNFIDLQLSKNFFDGIFANASLFHVPKQEFKKILVQLKDALIPQGILFSSNPRGSGEDFYGERYGFYMELDEYRSCVENAGFKLIHHYYRPEGLPLEKQPWLACVFRK